MSPATGSLRVLVDRRDGGADVNILLIPGVGTDKPDDWVFSSSQWLARVLPNSSRRARVLAFDYSMPFSESEVSSQDFLVLGDILLNTLVSSQNRLHGDTRPLFGVCHSLGGLILKQALCIAHEQPYRYGSVLSSVAGVVFLGTPHRGVMEADTLSRWLAIFTSTANIRKPLSLPANRVALETAMLTQLADRFEDVNLQAPVLSVAESKTTRVSKTIWKNKSILLTDTRLCTTNPPNETVRSFPLEHAALCHVELSNEPNKDSLETFIREALDEAEVVVSAKLAALDFKYATSSTYSPVESAANPIPEERDSQNVRDSTGRAPAESSDQGFEMILPVQDDVTKKPTVSLPCVMLESNDPFSDVLRTTACLGHDARDPRAQE